MENGDLDAVKAKPAMLASGDMDFAVAQSHSTSDFRGLFPEAPIVKLSGVGHLTLMIVTLWTRLWRTSQPRPGKGVAGTRIEVRDAKVC